MNIGIPRERRIFEYRVGLTPSGVQMLSQQGHTIYVEHNAGMGAGFSDTDYEQAGARIVYSPHEVFGRADLVLKVARPMMEEIEWLRPGTTIAGLLHLASARHDKLELLYEKDITAIPYEQIRLDDGSFPIRHVLSQIGGRLAAQIGARLLQNNAGGKGVMLGGIAGVPPAEVAIIGAGVVGTCAAQIFVGMGAQVTVLDTDLQALERIVNQFPHVVTMISNPINISRVCAYADVLVGAILVHGERPPIVVTRDMVRSMKPRSVIMDISIDEGGCVETSRPTNHEHPTYIEEGVIHYCVPNIPSVVARSATYAFQNTAFPFIFEIANKGTEKAIQENPAIQRAVQTYRGDLRLHLSTLNNGK
ncbi:MAG: alanine dehydrogenase [Chloroflexi bacterium]|jgi:alanine dehydrogenase|nr:alanine dehydrogenase [Chloroflexota bacterium]